MSREQIVDGEQRAAFESCELFEAPAPATITAEGFEDFTQGVASDIEIKVLSEPSTAWQRRVDEIEAPFAPTYDVVESKAALEAMYALDQKMMLAALADNGSSDCLASRRFLVGGCGTGRELITLAERGGVVDGIDATYPYLQATRGKCLKNGLNSNQVALYQSPLENFSAGASSYDGVTSLFGVLNHVEAWATTIRTLSNMLKSGGAFIASFYGPNQARVFRYLEQGRLPYAPAIVQRRVPGGITIDSSGTLLPASFPTLSQVENVLVASNLEPTFVQGFLDRAALFPDNPTSANLLVFKEVIAFSLTEDANADDGIAAQYLSALSQAEDASEILRLTVEFDCLPQNQSRENLFQFAYFGITARKMELQ